MKNLILCAACALILASATSCNDDDKIITYNISTQDTNPADLPASTVTKSGTITFTELNTGTVYNFNLPLAATDVIPAGTYDIEATKTVEYSIDGVATTQTLKAYANQQVISENSKGISLNWFFYNPESSLVFSEIYTAGSPNAKGTSGLYDTYFKIYNNTDEVIYADGIAIVESKILNSATDEILTAANDPEANFTVGVVYVIPGNGTDVAIAPGESIKIADQAIDFNASVAGSMDNTDADFEWFDETTKGMDTDNPTVPNLDKWFSYSATIWIPSNQCNRSYAIVRFPDGMTSEKFLSEQKGDYEYINSATGTTMKGSKCYLIPYQWILDGVNLCDSQSWKRGALSVTADAGYAAISDITRDPARFGKKFVRKTSGKSAAGHTLLMDTDNSSTDFQVVSAK